MAVQDMVCDDLQTEVSALRDQSNDLIKELLVYKQVVHSLDRIRCFAVILKSQCKCAQTKTLIRKNEYLFREYDRTKQLLVDNTSDEAIMRSIADKCQSNEDQIDVDEDGQPFKQTISYRQSIDVQSVTKNKKKQTKRVIRAMKSQPLTDKSDTSFEINAKTLPTNRSEVIVTGNGFRCGYDDCPFECRRRNTIDKHIKSYHLTPDGRPYQCDVDDCRNAFRTKEHLRQHKLSLHPEVVPDAKWIECEFPGCQYRTKSSNVFFKHKRSHTLPFECHLCDRRFPTPQPLELHIKMHSGVKEHVCPYCSKAYGPRKSLYAHIQRCHSDHVYDCDVPDCGKQFQTETQLRLHRQRMHDPTYERPVACIWVGCDRRFETNAQMEDHLNKHTGERFHVCNHCNHSFTTKSDLYSHISNQHKDRPFACNYPDCKFKAAFMSRLRTHQKRHEIQNKRSED
ncbi:zinc finger protein 771-like [Oppia nitens]|uniref:zinc finger protein 771-like n=1 Tax=Oppia nitens TaxID=1686743 RepID=UPI0023DBC891|nr:zinc finger protein 771-like [Oppia nitens]